MTSSSSSSSSTAASGTCLGDNTVAAYLARQLDAAEMLEVEEHIDKCATCRRHLSELAGSQLTTGEPAASATPGEPSALLTVGTKIGRYVVGTPLGEGGMGVVYRARDPELGRDVALKMVRRAEQLEARLLREAQAMARLSHRNVVAVYDRIVHEELGLFIAMELIDGPSLAKWLKQEPRTFRQVLDVFLEAGAGLAAAHAAGLVHRDFKPDNVLIDEAKKRVCVTDFGLSRLEALPASKRDLEGEAAAGALASLTQSGTLIGTPAYMAPEQHRGETADAQTDQFCFCVTMHEALYGEPPFEGETLEARRAAVLEGRFRPLPAKSDVPKWIAELLARGMHSTRSERHPSMAALLKALEERGHPELVLPDDQLSPYKWASRRPLLIGALALVLILAATAFVISRRRSTSAHASSPTQPQPSDSALVCSQPTARLAGVWDEHRKAQMRDSFIAIDKPYAADAWRATERTLDEYGRQWSTVYTDACAKPTNTNADVTQLRRLACLEERRAELRTLGDAFTHADAALVGRAVSAAQALTRVSHCRAESTVIRTAAPPDAATLPKVLAVKQELGKIRALHATQRWKEMAPLADPAVASARATNYKPVIAEALCWSAAAYSWTRESDKTIAQYREAATIAEAVTDDRLRIAAVLGLLNATETAGKLDLAREHERQLIAISEAVPKDEEVQYQLQFTIGITALRRGDIEPAEHALRRSLAVAEKVDGPESWNAALVLSPLALTLGLAGKPDEAAAMNEHALKIQLALVGPENPTIFIPHTTAAIALMELLRSAEAEKHLREALRFVERDLGPKDATTADILDYLGRSIADQDKRTREALTIHQRALAIREEALPADHHDFIYSLAGLGNAYLLLKEPAKAIPHLERALKFDARDKTKEIAEVQLLLAQALVQTKRDRPRARDLASRARVVYAKLPRGPRHDRDMAALDRLDAALK